jgi:large subunit ribosomal protein L1
MPKRGNKYIEARKKIDPEKGHELKEALNKVKEIAFAKFDETIEMSIKLGIDPRHSDQMVRGTVSLPYGTGKEVRVLAFVKGEKEKEAEEAGADYVGSTDLIEKIKGGWFEFDKAVATPDMMSEVGKIGKILGPRGLMPNPKVGTVTFDVAKAVKEIKTGKVEFRVDKSGNMHIPIGKVSFNIESLFENAKALLETVIRLKPLTSKGVFLRNIVLASTQGPGIKVDPFTIKTLLK